MNKSQSDRFWANVEKKPDGCWLWTGAVNQSGYGRFSIERRPNRTMVAHRVSYIEKHGDIPEGLCLDHLCRVRNCVNPAHLEAVTQAENNWRSPVWAGNATHCRAGHPYSGDNLLFHKRGERVCRICKNESNLRYYHRTKNAQRENTK